MALSSMILIRLAFMPVVLWLRDPLAASALASSPPAAIQPVAGVAQESAGRHIVFCSARASQPSRPPQQRALRNCRPAAVLVDLPSAGPAPAVAQADSLVTAPAEPKVAPPAAATGPAETQVASPVTATAPAAVQVTFLAAAAARQAIIDDSVEPYFSVLQPMEMAAKTGAPLTAGALEAQRGECRSRYQEAVRNFSPEEQDLLRWAVERIEPILDTDYPLLAHTPWCFLKIAGHIEGGLPHTRGPCIILSEPVLSQLVAMRKLLPEDHLLAEVGNLLIHEQTHVLQRQRPDLFATLYIELWGLQRAKSIATCPYLVEHHLANPDGVDCPWVLGFQQDGAQRWIWPLLVFGEAAGPPRMPRDFKMLAIDLEPEAEGAFRVKLGDHGEAVWQDLAAVPQYTSLFAGSGNIYHPNEAAADLFARMVLLDALPPKRMSPAAASEARAKLAPLRQWFREHLKRRD